MLVELPWFSHRSAWHLIFGGVLERHPSLQVVLTEQGLGWLPRGLETLDWFYGRMTLGGAAEASFFGAAAQGVVPRPGRARPIEPVTAKLGLHRECPPATVRLPADGFDLEALRVIGDRIGPTVADVATPLAVEDYPTDSTCNAFDRHQVLRAW